MQKLTAICLSVTIAAASLLSGHVFASDEAPQTDYLTGWELLAELREMGLGQDVILDEEAPESDNSSETNTEDPSDTTGEPGDGDQTDGTEPGNPDEGGSGEGDTDPGESTPEQPGDGDQTGGTEPGNPDGNNPGEGGSGEGDTDTDTDPGTDNPGEQPDNSDPAAGTDPDQGDGAEQGTNQNQPFAPAESTESASGEVPLVTQNDEMTVNDPQIPGETPAPEEDDNTSDEDKIPENDNTSDEDKIPEDDNTSDEDKTPENDNTSDENKTPENDNTSNEDKIPENDNTSDEDKIPEGGDTSNEGETPEGGDTSNEGETPENSPSQPESSEGELPETSGITEEQRAELEAYVQTLDAEQVVSLDETDITIEEYTDLYSLLTRDQLRDIFDYKYPTVTYTDAGPILYTTEVDVTPSRYNAIMAAPYQAEEEENGLILDKTAEYNEDTGTYTITLEAYTTGTVKTETSTTPVDIVLVLDQSGSMADSFGNTSRQEAMKQAVSNFIDSVADKYDAENADHRISIVTFGSEARILRGWTYVDKNGAANLRNNVNMLSNNPEGATRVDLGMQSAEQLMGNGYNYGGTNSTRSKVVVLFTDGVPTNSEEKHWPDFTYRAGQSFAVDTASDAIQSAYNLKQNGNTVYTIGIYDNVNPEQIYGGNSGNIDDYWSIISVWGLFGDLDEADIPAGNRFLNFISSNFESATEIGLSRLGVDILGISYIRYTITQAFSRNASSYFLSARNSEELNNVFENISEDIGSPNIELGPQTIVQDVISQYFTLPAGADKDDIKVYTSDYDYGNPNDRWKARVEFNGALVSIEGDDDKTIQVTNYNFNDHFVNIETGKQPEDSGPSQKLIIEFEVVPEEGFLGGNAVPTNTSDSKVYNGSGFSEAFPEPSVNVPINYIFSTVPQTIYLGNEANASAAVTLPQYTGADDWKDDYVTIGTPVWNVENPEAFAPDDCGNYDVVVTVKPNDEPVKEGPANDMDGKVVEKKATVHVLKPTFTFSDTKKDSGAKVDLTNENLKTIEWSDFDDSHSAGTATGPVPTFVLTYDRMEAGGNKPDGASFTVDSVANFKLAGVTIDGFNVTLKRDIHYKVVPDNMDTCDVGLGTGHIIDRDFTIHLNNFNLTIEKKLATGTTAAPNESFRIIVTNKDTGFTTSFMLEPDEQVILTNLPAGIYTIREDTDWSWRYDEDKTTVQVGSGESTEGTSIRQEFTGDSHVTFTNTKTNNHWLSWEDTKVNVFNPAS